MANPMLAVNFGDLLDSRVRKVYAEELENRNKKDIRPSIYRMETTTKNYEILSGIGGGSDLQDFDGTISYDSVQQLWDKTTYFPEKAKGMKIERKLYDDDLTGLMNQKPWQLAYDVFRTEQKMAIAPWNSAFVGTGGADSQPMCSSSHPYSPTDATTQDNAGNTKFSAVAVEATRVFGMTSIYNDRGELYEVNYDTIFCAPYKQEEAYELISSAGKVDTPNNNINFHRGKYDLLVSPRLTNKYVWFMFDSVLLKQFFVWWTRIAPDMVDDRDFDTFVAKWAVYTRQNPDFYDWRPVYGHLATS